MPSLLCELSEGYTTDDNARALIVAMQHVKTRLGRVPSAPGSAAAISPFCLSHLSAGGRFRNFLTMTGDGWRRSDGRQPRPRFVGAGNRAGPFDGLRHARRRGQLFEAGGSGGAHPDQSPCLAFSILGLQGFLDWFPGDRVIKGARNLLANRLLELYDRCRTDTWRWFEKSLA